jgi:hypothetical protein
MITKLLPDQISKFWPVVKYAVEQSLPPTVGDHPDKMNRVLSGMLSGKLDVWVSYRHEGEVTKFDGIIVTQILYDDASNTKSLLIYSIYAYESTLPTTWAEGFESLFKYAKSKGCYKCIAYSSVPYVVEQAKKFGADTSFTFISFPLPSSVNDSTNLMGV